MINSELTKLTGTRGKLNLELGEACRVSGLRILLKKISSYCLPYIFFISNPIPEFNLASTLLNINYVALDLNNQSLFPSQALELQTFLMFIDRNLQYVE